MKKWWLDKRLGLLLFAVVLGGFAAWGTRNYIQQQVEDWEEKNKEELASVVVAAFPLAKGVVVNEQNLATREVPVAWIPTGAVLPHEFSAMADRALNQPLQSGEILLWSHLQSADPPTFSQRLQEGKRALSVAVDDLHAIAGLIQPGDYIDLYVALEYAGKSVNARLLENIHVLATGQQLSVERQNAEEGSRQFSSLTLELTPEQAEHLIVARESARLIPVLKPPQDKTVTAHKKLDPLSKTLGIQLNIPAAKKKVPVIYGDRTINRIPSLQSSSQPSTEVGSAQVVAEPLQSGVDTPLDNTNQEFLDTPAAQDHLP